MMNWKPSWRGEVAENRNENSSGRLYCEMNNKELRLKIKWQDKSHFTAFISAVERAAELIQAFGLMPKYHLREPNKYTDTWAVRSFSDLLSEPQAIARCLGDFVPGQFLPLCDRIRQLMDSPS